MSLLSKKKVYHQTFEWVIRDIYLCEKLYYSRIEGPNFEPMDPSFAWSLELGQSNKPTAKGISLFVKRNRASKEVSVNMRVTVHKGKESNKNLLLDAHFKETFKPEMLWESPVLVTNGDFRMEFIKSKHLCKSWKVLVELMYFDVVEDDSARIPLAVLDKKAIGDDLIKLYKSGQLVDNELKCVDGRTFEVHNAIISARCPYFTQKLSEYEGAPPKKRKISFDFDPSSEEMKCLLFYIYAGSIDRIDTPDPLPLRISECAKVAKLGDLEDATESQGCKSEGYVHCEPFTFDWDIGYYFRDAVQELGDLEKRESEELLSEKSKAYKSRKTKTVSGQEFGISVEKTEMYPDFEGNNAYFFGFQAMKEDSDDSGEDNSLKMNFITDKYDQEPFEELNDEYFESLLREEQLKENEEFVKHLQKGSKFEKGNQESEQSDKYTKPFESSIFNDFGAKEEFQLVMKIDSLNGSLYISPYLKLIKGEEKIYVFIKFSIKHNMRRFLCSKKLVKYLEPGESVGIPNFFSLEELQKRNTYEDCLSLICDITYSRETDSVKNHINSVYTTSDTIVAADKADEEYLEQFQPKYDRYYVMSDNLKKLLESKEFSDCMIVVDDGSFPAHKAILAARSSYFGDLFLDKRIRGKPTIVLSSFNAEMINGYAEMGEIIKIENHLRINSSQMEIILQEIYTGSATVEKSMHDNMKPLAEFFGLPSLKRKCSGCAITTSPKYEERFVKNMFTSKSLLDEMLSENGGISPLNEFFKPNGSA